MKIIENPIIVTRHPNLVEHLVNIGLIQDDAVAVTHVKPEQVKDRNVIGILPHSLSCLTRSFTEVPLFVPEELRGVELTVEQIEAHAQEPVTYQVNVID